MERTGWIWVTSCLVALVASQGCPDEDLNLKKWSDDQLGMDRYMSTFSCLKYVYAFGQVFRYIVNMPHVLLVSNKL